MTQNQPVDSRFPSGMPLERRSSSASERSTQASLAYEVASSQTSNHGSQDSEDGENEDDGSEAGSEDLPIREPAYSTQELVAILLDFYNFLTTLHFDPANLKTAPPEGWQNLTPEILSILDKSEYVLDLIRHIPYFKQSFWSVGFLYKSQLCDIPEYTLKDFEEEMWWTEDYEFVCTRGDADRRHFIRLAEGRESGGRMVWLNAKDGEIVDCDIRGDVEDPVDIQVYFDSLKERYRNLELFPGPPSIVTQEYEEMPDSDDTITEAEFLEQGPEISIVENVDFGRKLYRRFRWPDAFQREQCWKEVERLQGKMNDMDDSIWEGSPLYGRQ
ncbi:translation machinery-associated protein 64 [Fusarium sporotrichioides]|uniref:Translation machinery-associated protein 64 n=1 Tax=Fusarium sporotrichioides TaxID=5514 RepID=A0A395RLG1_FUSSP|nr:translation machinery-associated protein 64 [Fusarium sporotrichioides]